MESKEDPIRRNLADPRRMSARAEWTRSLDDWNPWNSNCNGWHSKKRGRELAFLSVSAVNMQASQS